MENYLSYAICAVFFLIAGMALMHYISSRGSSTKEQLLKLMAKTSKALAALNDPGADEQVAIAARLKREELLNAEIAANFVKINKPAV